MTGEAYRGWIEFVDLKARPQRRMLMLQTRAGFTTAAGGECSLDVRIAVVNWQPA
jgi:hypothetical protein